VLLSRQADYAVRLVFELAKREPEQANTRDVAAEHRVPEAYLHKVVQRLSRAGLLSTLRGPHGGIRLSRPPSQVSLRDVVEAVDGPIAFNRCQKWPGDCSDSEPCPIHSVWQHLSDVLTQSMEEVTFDVLARRGLRDGVDAEHASIGSIGSRPRISSGG
jgi:Rrf2 family protein